MAASTSSLTSHPQRDPAWGSTGRLVSPAIPHRGALLALLLAVAWLGLPPAVHAEESSTLSSRPVTDLALRDVVGMIVGTEVEIQPGGERWVLATLRLEDEPDVRLALGPAALLEHAGFLLASGDPVRVRYFVGSETPGVERIRNLHSGRTLRLRCLRGKPVWDPHHLGALGRRGGDSMRRVGGSGNGGGNRR